MPFDANRMHFRLVAVHAVEYSSFYNEIEIKICMEWSIISAV